MNTPPRTTAFLVVGSAVLAAGAVAWAGGSGGARIGGVSVMAACAGLAFLVQWVAFVPSYVKQTEHYYDLVGSLTYISVTVFALIASGATNLRAWVLTGLVLLWAGRLGSFLFRRVRAQGSDARFDDIKVSVSRFFVAWTLQGLWVFLTLCAALAAITTLSASRIGALDWVGLTVWVAGFAIEVASDRQKSRFRASHPGQYVDEGLWAWSRHPNYFGEILLWTGVAIMAASTLRGWQWVTTVSPVFVALLLTRVSGIPILEKRADERWGDSESYRQYKANTPVLIPRPPRR